MTFLKSRKGIICIILASVLVVCGVCTGLGFWYYNAPKFQDVTVELGTQSVTLSQFMTKYANADATEVVAMMTDYAEYLAKYAEAMKKWMKYLLNKKQKN